MGVVDRNETALAWNMHADACVSDAGREAEDATTALVLMRGAAKRTGFGGGGTCDRYLWTDAFAVCTLLGRGLNEVMLATSLAPGGYLGRRDLSS
jgi:hypothetical protein